MKIASANCMFGGMFKIPLVQRIYYEIFLLYLYVITQEKVV